MHSTLDSRSGVAGITGNGGTMIVQQFCSDNGILVRMASGLGAPSKLSDLILDLESASMSTWHSLALVYDVMAALTFTAKAAASSVFPALLR